MLSREENELLTRVEGDAPMGQMMRRYWLAAALSDEVAEADGTPVRVRLLGENLVLFRDTEGRLGLIDGHCPHRLASLALGRNEEAGLRCIYHGWKFDVAGRCVEMPTEPESYNFRDRMSVRSYPTLEAGGMVWTYLGPEGTAPPFPRHDWMDLPATHRTVVKIASKTNYLQATEGSIDSAHSWFLHRGGNSARDWATRTGVSTDTSPKLEAEDTAYGFRYAAIRRPNENPDTEKYVRVTLFQMPSTAFIPRSLDANTEVHVQIFVPTDDENSNFYGVFFSQNGQPIRDMHAYLHARPGIDVDDRFYRFANEDNGWNQDRAAMKSGESWCGIEGFANQDIACQESMGPIVDRTREHLGTSDVAIIRMRRRMLEAVERFQNGEPLIGHDPSIPYDRLRSEQKILPIDAPWQQVGAFAGEFVPH
jgi:phthalate 4,5-dioxygenase oxygenase subunit